GAHRHRPARRGLPERTVRAGPGPDSASPPRHAERDRERRLLPGLRPGSVRHGRDHPGRRRPHALPAVRLLSPARLGGLGLFLLAVVVLALWILPSDSYIFLPDRAHPVAPLVKIAGRTPVHDDRGGIYFVDVFVRKASWLERLFPSIRDGATIVPASAVLPPGTSEKARLQEDRQAMTRSQSIAAAVALRAAGYKVR